jgi:ribulose-phosphate 3-epimerase
MANDTAKILCPSMLNLPAEQLTADEIKAIDESGIDLFHIDIMDLNFVPNMGLAFSQIELIRKNTKKPLDCHMMVTDPRRYIKRIYEELGCNIIYIHPEAELIPSETLAQIRELGAYPGITVNPYMSLDHTREMLPIVDYVMIMGVNPGYAGRDYLSYVTPKAKMFNDYRVQNDLKYKIVLDGGADEAVIRELYHACGVEGFVLGKQLFFFQDKPYKECVDFIRSI